MPYQIQQNTIRHQMLSLPLFSDQPPFSTEVSFPFKPFLPNSQVSFLALSQPMTGNLRVILEAM